MSDRNGPVVRIVRKVFPAGHFAIRWGVDAQKMIGRLDQTMGTTTHVPQGGVIWVFAVKN